MGDLRGARIAVVGGGAFGLLTAVGAADLGGHVTLFSPEPHASASLVAAGMLGPVSEALLERDPGAAYARFAAALELWRRDPRLAKLIRVAGALYLDPSPADLGRLAALGAPYTSLEPKAAARLQPGVRRCDRAVWLPEEAALDPRVALAALRHRLTTLGGTIVGAAAPSLAAPSQGWLKNWDAVVIAAGYASRAWADAFAALRGLTPIKGHILRFQAPPANGPVVRAAEGYVAPQSDGALFGATMQFGQADGGVEAPVVEALHAAALRQAPGLVGAAWTAHVGVRAQMPDGLPLAGRLDGKVWAATGARRNGWLLAPLVAQAVVAGLAGDPIPSAASDFSPTRFA